MPDPTMFDAFLHEQARALRAGDVPPTSLKVWDERRKTLRAAMFAAMGPFPEKPCPLEPREVGVLKRDGYRIEKVLFQTRPDVWATATVYVPDPVKEKAAAVLAVHGHWAGARRDPVVQARCLGLVQLGFVVLTLDAFGAGERHPDSARGGYHGALIGSTLWPAGQTLVGLQVYDNRRAVDYLLTRPEVDGERIGVTGASGGGNQTMYAGALDERLKAVVPVCSVGTYLSYLKAACCMCEVLPGALRFTEEGDVLGLVAPRALMVVSATMDSFNFSVGEAKKSLERAAAIFKLHDAAEKLKHAVFDSPHAYSQPMREAMYGWMTRWLRGEGKGDPVPEPKHTVEKIEDLSCFADGKRPPAFVYPATFAAREAARLLAPLRKTPDHKEAWEAQAVVMRGRLRDEVFGGFPKAPKPAGKLDRSRDEDGVTTVPLTLPVEPGLDLSAQVRFKRTFKAGKIPACLLLHLDGGAEALKHPLAAALVNAGWVVVAPDLRATGAAKPPNDAVGVAPDHNSAEHAVWVGRPLLGQWTFDVQCLLEWMAVQPGYRADHLAVVGVGEAGVVAVTAAGALDHVAVAAAVDAPATFVTEHAYAAGTRMGLLANGILRVGDVPHLAALAAPHRLIVSGAVSPQGKKLGEKEMGEAFGFTRAVYKLLGAEESLSVRETATSAEMATWLAPR
jgi:dienelactone hydrolase